MQLDLELIRSFMYNFHIYSKILLQYQIRVKIKKRYIEDLNSHVLKI